MNNMKTMPRPASSVALFVTTPFSKLRVDKGVWRSAGIHA
jgi:hypothetical protein